jgi:Leucine-rich repeat (LRR) protein
MAKGKKGKKDKGPKKPPPPEQVTTLQILEERTKMLCPRLGDVYNRSMTVEEILRDVVDRTITKTAMKGLPFLRLCGHKIAEAPDFVMLAPQLKGLVEINLSRNQLFNTESLFQSLSCLPSITNLNLSFNFLNRSIPDSAAALVNLEKICLDVNQLTSLGPAVSAWSHLTSFSCADNSLVEVIEECSSWPAVTYVNLKNNKIAAIPINVLTAWKDLKSLLLGSNLIPVIPDEISGIAALQTLDLSNNALEVLPPSLSQCTNLQLLHVGNNKLMDISPELFTSLTNLKELQLYKNKLTIVPPEIGNLTLLERVSLASNQIRDLPEEIGTCTSIQELYLGNNAKFSYFPVSAGHMQKLKELSMYKCPALKQLPPTISELGCLQLLDLRTMKKDVCKVDQYVVEDLEARHVKVLGAVIKKGKAPPKKEEVVGGGGGGGGGGDNV